MLGAGSPTRTTSVPAGAGGSGHEERVDGGEPEEVLTYDPTADTPCPAFQIIDLDRCPVCECQKFTRVSWYNKLILFDRKPDDEAPIYYYSLCHDCGVVFAARRPAQERFQPLFEPAVKEPSVLMAMI